MQNTILQQHMPSEKDTETSVTSLNGVWKSMIKEMTVPASDMSEEEMQAYEARIRAKLKKGKKLTAKEMEFLRAHNPELYRVALRVQNRKEQLVQQLKNCKSKAEAIDIARRSVAGISSDDPDKEYMVAGLSETIRQFKKSSAYARLPEKDEPGNKKKRGRALDFEEKGEEDPPVINTPIREVLDELPTFDVVQ